MLIVLIDDAAGSLARVPQRFELPDTERPLGAVDLESLFALDDRDDHPL